LINHGFKGIGVGPTTIHADMRPTKKGDRRIARWTYFKDKSNQPFYPEWLRKCFSCTRLKEDLMKGEFLKGKEVFLKEETKKTKNCSETEEVKVIQNALNLGVSLMMFLSSVNLSKTIQTKNTSDRIERMIKTD